MKLIQVLQILIPVFLFSCASNNAALLNSLEKPEIFSDQVNRAQMIGAWLGESKSKDGGSVKWLDKRYADGGFEVRFKGKDPDGSPHDHTEVGIWGISGGIYFVATRGFIKKGKVVPVDTTSANYYDAYKTLKISPSEIIYKSLTTQDVFTATRVPDDFSL